MSNISEPRGLATRSAFVFGNALRPLSASKVSPTQSATIFAVLRGLWRRIDQMWPVSWQAAATIIQIEWRAGERLLDQRVKLLFEPANIFSLGIQPPWTCN